MNVPTTIATNLFDWSQQQHFAELSGDRNPMHMDPLAARRTQAGQPVVHGIQAVLWALEELAKRRVLEPGIAQLKIRFRRMIYVGDRVGLEITQCDAAGIRAQLTADEVVVTGINIALGAARSGRQNSAALDLPAAAWPEDPVVLSLQQMQGRSGSLAFVAPAARWTESMPALARVLGAERIAALACMSRLIGMVCPGLHSIFSSLTVSAAELEGTQGGIRYQVSSMDEGLRLVKQSVEGGGWSGTVESFARVPPVEQPRMDELAAVVRHDEFKGASALIIGGSRGLGELTAKSIAAGGGAVTVTYATGLSEAQEVQRQIRAWGGCCEIMQYDAGRPAGEQLSALRWKPSSLYYFATSSIAVRKRSIFTASAFEKFERIYVRGFYDACTVLSQFTQQDLSVFYPSSVSVDERPPDMTEYAMAKAAGELLCSDLARYGKGLRVIVKRLPRMLTDLTATVMPTLTHSALDVMLPIVREVEARDSTRKI